MAGILEISLGKAVLAAVLASVAVAGGLLRAGAALRHLLWLAVLGSLFFPPLLKIPLVLDPFSDESAPRETSGASPAAAVPAHGSGAAVPTATIEVNGASPAGGEDRRTVSSLAWPSTAGLLMGMWLLGSIGILIVAFGRIRRCRRLLAETTLAPAPVQEEVCGLGRRWGLVRSPRVCLTERCAPPFLWALGRARMVIPRSLWEVLDATQRRTLLAHELAHYARRDHWTRWLELSAVILYWWHPAVWLARAQLRAAEEELADARVIAAYPGTERCYGETLLRSLDLVAGDLRWRSAAESAFGLRSLARRLRLLRDGMVAKPLAGRARALFVSLAIPCLALGIRFGATEARPIEPSDEAIPYPHALPPWYEELERKLSKRVDMDVARPTALANALSAAGKILDLKVEFRDGAAGKAESLVQLDAVSSLPAKLVMNLLIEQAGGLRLALVPGAVVITDTPQKYPLPQAARVRSRIEAARRYHRKEAREERRKTAKNQEELEARLKRTMVTFAIETALSEIIDALRQVTGIPLLIDPEIDATQRVSLRVRDVTAEKALERLLRPLELSWIFKEQVLLVLPEADAARAKRRLHFEEARRARVENRIKKLMETRLPPGLSGKRPRELTRPLREALGLPVYPDPAAWAVSRRIRLSGRNRTVRDLVKALERTGVRMLVEEDGIFLLAETP